MNEKQKERAEALGLSQDKAEEIVKSLNLPSTESEEDKVSNAATWDRYTGFKFPADLVELFNVASKLNALFIKQTPVEFDRWKGYGEDPDFFCKAFAEAMEHCTDVVQELSEYAKQLIQEEMFEKYK